jgi:DNA invertase Pin-like site-specific DNA recombinase
MLSGICRTRDGVRLPLGRAVIYLREPYSGETNHCGDVPSIDAQRLACRDAAITLHAEVVGEFVDRTDGPSSQRGLRQVLDLAEEDPQLHFLIVSSLDRLTDNRSAAFQIGWLLGSVGTIVVRAGGENSEPPFAIGA